MAQIAVWYDDATESWTLADGETNRVILELRRDGEYDDPANPWLPDNPCLLRTLGEGSALTIDVKDGIRLVVDDDD